MSVYTLVQKYLPSLMVCMKRFSLLNLLTNINSSNCRRTWKSVSRAWRLRAHRADRRSYSMYHSHLGVYPVHFPLGKHLLIAGPIIVYPGLQKYQIYCPAQWFSLWITTAEFFGLPGSPLLGKTRKQPRKLNWLWSSTSCLRLTMLKKKESWLSGKKPLFPSISLGFESRQGSHMWVDFGFIAQCPCSKKLVFQVLHSLREQPCLVCRFWLQKISHWIYSIICFKMKNSRTEHVWNYDEDILWSAPHQQAQVTRSSREKLGMVPLISLWSSSTNDVC